MLRRLQGLETQSASSHTVSGNSESELSIVMVIVTDSERFNPWHDADGSAKALAGSVRVDNGLQSGGCVTLPFGGDGHSGIGRVDKRGFLQRRRRVVQWPRHGGAGQRAQIASVLGTVWHILAYQ